MSGFPTMLEDKLLAMLEPLRAFGKHTEFVSKIGDFDRETVAAPDFDDSDWPILEDKVLKRDQGVTWVRAKYTVPEMCADIAIAGSQLRVCAEGRNANFAPLEVYIDGKLALKERSWMDFKCPEGIITEDAVPGKVHTIAWRFDLNEKCYWLNNVSLRVVSERVDKCIMHVESIIAELKFMESFEGTAELLEKAYALLAEAADSGRIMQVLEAEKAARALFEGFRGTVKQYKVSLVGHAHIDMNWFWSMQETRDIVKRDFTTMTKLMEKYPDFCFSQSQCSTYEIASEDCPEVFEKIQKYEKEGRWDVTASTWVEGDLNMAQGESIARHVLYAKEYIGANFSKLPNIMWCPDTFGHPGTIPQILKKSGIDRYYHMRCGLGVGSYADSGYPNEWAFLADSKQTPVYWWKGVDGSRVLVCNTQYSRNIDTRGMLLASKRCREFGLSNAMLTYGTGDHGGGPTMRDLDWILEVRDYPTVPTIEFSTTDRYYSEIEQGNYDLPEHSGEMNFVFDGCYTTHADVKRQNRLCEEGLIAVEKLYTLAAEYGVEYPYDELRKCWRKTLFNQFHDILDGSGVKDTYVFTKEEAAYVLGAIDAMTQKAMTVLAKKFGQPGEHSYIVFNPTGFERSETVSFDVEKGKAYAAFDAQGHELPCQTEGGIAKVYVRNMPASGLTTVTLKATDKQSKGHIIDCGEYYRVHTPLYEVEICKNNGQITTLYDIKRDWFVVNRERIGWRLKKGVLNSLQFHMEEPTAMSGWTIGNVRTVHTLLDGAQSEIICDGETEARIRFTHHFMSSTITQDIVIRAYEPEIRFETEVDWQEWGNFDRDAPMLRVYFAPDVKNVGKATYEIPFGALERSTMDAEYPALSWVDISDEEHGFALLNDCKYGHKCRGNGLEMTLIRSGWLPDQKSDIGFHKFTYAILPHDGNWEQGNVIAAGQAINQKPVVSVAEGSCTGIALPQVEGAVLSNIKRAEDGKGMILRIYRPEGSKTKAVVYGIKTEKAAEVDLLEKEIGALEIKDGVLFLDMNDCDIRSIKLFD